MFNQLLMFRQLHQQVLQCWVLQQILQMQHPKLPVQYQHQDFLQVNNISGIRKIQAVLYFP
jgi:hypothetical protein